VNINYYICYKNKVLYKYSGDWGLGIGDWAQSPIPNPQSPNIKLLNIKLKV